jgi:predicted dehydrogenase
MAAHFVPRRPLPRTGSTAFTGAGKGGKTGPVTVEDALFMVAQFDNGALGSFNATRFALGRKNYNTFEIYGSKGAIAFNLERMNELEYFSEDDPSRARGFRTILATESEHPYIANWWPPGHIIGYEHEFTHAVTDFLAAVSTRRRITPNFADGVKIMQVLDAGLKSAATGRRVTIPKA